MEEQTTQAEMSDQGKGSQDTSDWRESLPEEYRNDPNIATIPDFTTLAKNYIETKRLVGRKGIIQPGEKDPPEKWDEFYKALGRPESPDKYEFVRPELPEGLTYAEDFEKDFREKAHKIGLTGKQARELYDWYVPLTVQWASVGREQLNKAKEELNALWGDKVEVNTRLASDTFKRFADEDDYRTMFEGPAPLGNDPRLVKLFYKVGMAMQEDKFVTGRAPGGVADIDQQIAEIERNPALYNPTAPEHDDLVAKRDELYRKKYPEK